jgi:hypothetical protein
MVLILISLNAMAESVPYTFGDITIPIPDTHYVLTRDKHDPIALGIENILSQNFADTLFESQPGLLIDRPAEKGLSRDGKLFERIRLILAEYDKPVGASFLGFFNHRAAGRSLH